jgi:hypothetical protein
MTKVHFFRDHYIGGLFGNPTHSNHKGTHGADPRFCRACVSVVVAVIDVDIRLHTVAIGIAYRHDDDQFNGRLARRIALGRAEKNLANGDTYPKIQVDAMIDYCYINSTERTDYTQKNRWREWLAGKDFK